MLHTLVFYLKVSRPGLWFPTIWLYMLPLAGTDFWGNSIFWMGLFYVLFPMNFMVYGWNDIVDYEADKFNPRKDSFLFGARGTPKQLQDLIPALIIVQLLTYPFLVWQVGFELLWVFFAQLLVLWAYNFPKKGLRGMPPFELACQFGYLLVVPFSIYCNAVEQLPWATYLYLVFFAVKSHLMGEVMDIDPDRKAGKETTATRLGRSKTKWLIIGFVMGEIGIIAYFFQDWIFAGMLAFGLVWLFLDLLLIFKSRAYTLSEMKLFGWASNLLALASMIYVWYSGTLVQ